MSSTGADQERGLASSQKLFIITACDYKQLFDSRTTKTSVASNNLLECLDYIG